MGRRRSPIGKEMIITKGKLKTIYKRVEGCKRIDRMIARKNMKDMGMTQICKGNKSGRNNKVSGKALQKQRRSNSKFSSKWKDYIY